MMKYNKPANTTKKYVQYALQKMTRTVHVTTVVAGVVCARGYIKCADISSNTVEPLLTNTSEERTPL